MGIRVNTRTLATMLDDLRKAIHDRASGRLALFDQYTAALMLARATGKDTDITKARELEDQVNGLFDTPSTRVTWTAARTALVKTDK